MDSLLLTTSAFLPFQHQQLLWLPLPEGAAVTKVAETLGPWLQKLPPTGQPGEDVLWFDLAHQPTFQETVRLETAARRAGVLPRPHGINKQAPLPTVKAHRLGAGSGPQNRLETVFQPRTLVCLWHPAAQSSAHAVQAATLVARDVAARLKLRVVGLTCEGEDNGAAATNALFMWTDGYTTLQRVDNSSGTTDAGRSSSSSSRDSTAAINPRASISLGARSTHNSSSSSSKESASAAATGVTHLAVPDMRWFSVLAHFDLHYTPMFVIVGADGQAAWSGTPLHVSAEHLAEALMTAAAEAFPVEEAISKSPYAKAQSASLKARRTQAARGGRE